MLFLDHFSALFIESAPWLLLGFAIAGFIKVFIPKNYLNRHLGGNNLWTTVKAAFIGAPLPLCSCGVVPTALGLRRAGVSKNATVSFLIATPETGIDSVSITYALMGPFMAIARPISAIFSAITAGILVGKTSEEVIEQNSDPIEPSNTTNTDEKKCCSSKKAEEDIEAKIEKQTIQEKLALGSRFAFIEMLDDIVIWFLIGLAFAAAIETWVPVSFLTHWGDSWVTFVIMALIGIPMYICATASTPIAAGLLLSGISPGAVLVFMLAGPATNLGTMGIILKELGKKATFAYLIGVILTSFICGYLTNYLVTLWGIQILPHMTTHAMDKNLIDYAATTVLAMLCVYSIGKKARNKFQGRVAVLS